jgi:hypothetical protein
MPNAAKQKLFGGDMVMFNVCLFDNARTLSWETDGAELPFEP